MQARGLRAAGAKVYIVGRRGEVLEQTAKVHGSSDKPLIPLTADVSTKEGCLALAEEFGKHEQKLDILVSNAGGVGPLNEGSTTIDASGQSHPEHNKERLSAEDFAKKSLEDKLTRRLGQSLPSQRLRSLLPQLGFLAFALQGCRS